MVRMLVTRPEPEAEHTAIRLRALGIEAALAPMLRFQRLETSLPDANGFAAMAVSSANSLRALQERDALHRYRALPVFAVGDATAERARALGFASVSSVGGTLADLAERLAHAPFAGPIFYPSARHTTGDLAKSLAPYGVMVVTARVYDMLACDALAPDILEQLRAGTIEAALIYSRRTAQTFVRCVADRLDKHERRRLTMLCISEGVAEPLIAEQFVRIGLADQPDEEAMMSLALSFARERDH